MVLTSHGLTDPGCVRSENQDRILLDDALGLYVVCDGMGGRRRGELAAELATNAIHQYVELSRDPKEVTWPYGYNLRMTFAANRVLTAAKLANRQVWRRSEEALEYLGMGTTITALLFDPGIAAIANIGDSRVYLWRAGNLEQLSADDTVGGSPPPTGEFSLALTRQPMLRGVLTRAAGSQENAEVHLKECPLQDDDVLLLCSDGLHGVVSEDRIAAVLSDEAVSSAASTLISDAREAGAPDNVSAVVVQYRNT